MRKFYEKLCGRLNYECDGFREIFAGYKATKGLVGIIKKSESNLSMDDGAVMYGSAFLLLPHFLGMEDEEYKTGSNIYFLLHPEDSKMWDDYLPRLIEEGKVRRAKKIN
jgi:hypothetical protein